MNIMLNYKSLSCLLALVSLSYSNLVRFGVNAGVNAAVNAARAANLGLYILFFLNALLMFFLRC